MSLPTVASLWIGGDLSFLEQVCLKSFIDYGHRTILYTYEGVKNAPEGVEVWDANTIFPTKTFTTHKKSGSPAYHADAFRYRMLELQNVIWVDADMLCVRPWEFESQYVFGWEKADRLVCNAVLGLPRYSRTLRALNDFCTDEYPIPPWLDGDEQEDLRQKSIAGTPVHMSEMKWGIWGPSAVTHFLNETGEIEHALPQETFFPVPFKDRQRLLDPKLHLDDELTDHCYGVHLWNRRLRRRLVTNHDGIPPSESFLGKAVIRHGVDPYAAMIPDNPPPGYPTQAELRKSHAAKTKKTTRSRNVSHAEPESNQSHFLGAPPAMLSELPLARLRQSYESQKAIENLAERANRLSGFLEPPGAPTQDEKILVVTGMKNEAPFILEWIAYHKAIGVDHFLVYTNDCADPTNEILDRLVQIGVVTRLDNPFDPASGIKPQHAALKDATKQQVYKDADWVLVIDVDEFVNIHVGSGTLKELLAATNYPNVISFTWKFFGNDGIADYEDCLITERFTSCAPEFLPKPRLGWGFKSMTAKRSPYGRIGVHRPLDLDENRQEEVRWVNGSGRTMPEMLHNNNGWRSTKRSLGYRLATLNHYVLRSAESYLVKRERGRINHTDQDQGLDYWLRRNYTSEEDRRIHDRLPMLRDELDILMADKTLARLHQDAVDWHKSRIERLLRDPDYRVLFDRITDPANPDALQAAKEEEEPKNTAFEVPAYIPLEQLGSVHSPQPPSLASPKGTHPRFGDAHEFTDHSNGFLWEGAENALMFVPKTRRLIVSFDNIHGIKNAETRWPWGMKRITQDLDCSLLGVMAVYRNWFRHDFVHDAFSVLRDSGFFDQFDDILFYGASMGGFGALTYSRVAPGSRVLAFAPQTTLDRRILPEDDRWGWTKKLDWDGPYADAAADTAAANAIYLISDPFFEPDARQIARLSQANVVHLRTPFMGHQLPNAFEQMGILRPLLQAAASGKLDANLFYNLYRARRDLPRFQHDLLMEAERRQKFRSAIRICEYTLKKRKAGNIQRSLDRLREELAEAEKV